ncbi:MAG: DDE-type integrase/transposase/recombinase [Bacteroidota bacterium]
MKAVYLHYGISRQSHFAALQRAVKLRDMEAVYLGLICELRSLHPGMGLRTMYNQFQPEGIGRDAFIALGLRWGFRLRAINNPYRTTHSVKSARYTNLLVGKRFTDVNQVWVSDLFYFSLQDQHWYVVLIMDIYSRRIIGYSVADNMRAENNLAALEMALVLRGVDNYNQELIHHSDRGSQYIAQQYTDTLEGYGIQISMCDNVLENAHIERANGTIKNDYLNRWDIQTPTQLIKSVKMAVNNYNNRLHRSLKMTPIEFEAHLLTIDQPYRNYMQIFTIDDNQFGEIKNQLSFFNLRDL